MAINGLFTHNKFSEGAKELSRALDVPRIKHQNSTFKGGERKVVINWGSTEVPEFVVKGGTRIVNNPVAVNISVDKLATFRRLADQGVPIPPYTTSLIEAQGWLAQGKTVFARTLTKASGGRGIVIMEPDDPTTHNTPAPLYSLYVKKQHEYRVHVAMGQVIDRQRKGLREEFRGHEDVNWAIRNLANGFVFVRNDGHQFPAGIDNLAISAVRALGLDFGAVDIISQKNGNSYVLEVNTAPGLQGTTVDSYANAFRAI